MPIVSKAKKRYFQKFLSVKTSYQIVNIFSEECKLFPLSILNCSSISISWKKRNVTRNPINVMQKPTKNTTLYSENTYS